MCAAVLGQCGPRVPRFKSLFHSQRYSEDVSFLRGDRQAELQSIWQDIGEDKCSKLEEVRQMIAAAVDKIYEKALEECVRRKMELQEMVVKSENRLKEYLGPTASQVIASKDLPLQSRLNMNMSRLHDLDNARLGGYGWVGGLVVLVELRHRVAVLREMLKLPPCDTFADLDEVLASTTEALHNLCPGKVSSIQVFHLPKAEPKPIFQRLQKFYQTLCVIENFCLDSFSSKETGKGFKDLHCSETLAHMRLQELECKAAKDGSIDFDRFADEKASVQLGGNPVTSFGFTKKRSSSRFGNKIKDTNKQSKQNSEDASRLEQLSQKILKKLEDINRHVICATKSVNTAFSPVSSYSQISDIEDSPSSGPTNNSLISKNLSRSMQSASHSSCSDDNGGGTPTSVLPGIGINLPNHSYSVNVADCSPHWSSDPPTSYDKTKQSVFLVDYDEDQTESLDACWAEQYEKDLQQRRKSGNARQISVTTATRVLESICRAAKKTEAIKVDIENKACPAKKEITVAAAPGNHRDSAPMDRMSSAPCVNSGISSTNGPRVAMPAVCATALAPSPKNPTHSPAASVHAVPSPSLSPAPAPAPSAAPAPSPAPAPALVPPPPPPPPPQGAKLQSFKSAKLKKSNTISRLYMGMKRKADGAEYNQSPLADGAVQRRSVTAGGTRDGMAEALAEITRRSSYFRKIEDDVQKHATSVLEIKSGLELFETRDMQKLLRFHESLEARLEQLTDESQVLSRFEGFPMKKLETVRAASSLYLRMSSLVHQVENWPVESPMSENLDKITSFFDKVKIDVEMIERTKDEDVARFHSQKISFSFELIIRIKEAVVGLSSKSLALALKESQRTKGSITIGDEYLSTKDMKKLKGSFQLLWRVFQLAFRAHNFAGGHDEKAEQLSCNVAKEMETYPSSFWLDLVNK